MGIRLRVSSGKMCKDKKLGGLGVKDARKVNLALLRKWHWRLLDYHPALWKDIVSWQFGSLVARSFQG